MKKSAKTGLVLMLISLLVFVFSLSMSRYRLTEKVLYEQFGQNYTGEGRSYYEVLRPEMENMLDKEYDSRFTFIADYRKNFNAINQPHRDAQEWDKVLHDDHLVMVVKHSAKGLLTDTFWFWLVFSFSFGGTVLGALLLIFSSYSGVSNGIHHNGIYHSSITARGWIGIVIGTFLILFYIVLYFFPQHITNWMLLADPVKKLFTSTGEADQWFLYGLMYCIAMLVMGVRMLLKYRGNTYQQVRTVSVLFFQICFAFMIPEILSALNQPSMDLKHIWPLNYSYFEGEKITSMYAFGGVGISMFWWGTGLFLIGVPLFTYFYGKRWYCSWVCGCGGLAETAGDPFRQLSDKSVKAWKIERWMIYSVLVFVTVMTVLVLIAFKTGQDSVMGISSGMVKMIYGFLIGSVFSGVVGTGFYPFMGNRVWCRFGCPLAAYLGIIQRFKSRFRITTNGGQCISCGNCSTYCEMGIDVRWYAQRGQNIVRSSCVGCGVCSSVCPRGVLKLENAPEQNRINDNPIIIGNDGVRLNENLK